MASIAGAHVPVLAVGFEGADALGALARHLGWSSTFLADTDRLLYARLGMRRAPWWRVFSPRTLAFYRRAVRVGPAPGRRSGADPAALDIYQMGGDAVLVDGVAVRRWLPRTPVDRVAPAVVVAAARGERSDGGGGRGERSDGGRGRGEGSGSGAQTESM